MTDIVEEILKDHGSTLIHYGVLGMHWGHRSGRYASASKGIHSRRGQISSKLHKRSNPGVDPITTTYLTIGAAFTAYHFVDSGKIHQFRTKNTPYKTNTALARKDMSVDSLRKTVVKPINPEFGKYGTKMNCRRCTLAYEMRRRGYDVRATRTSMATGQTTVGLIKAITPKGASIAARHQAAIKQDKWGVTKIGDKDFHKKSVQEKSDVIFEKLSSTPHGARGELAMGWTFGGGHSVAWENVKGSPVVFDTQSGKTYATANSLARAPFSKHMHEAAMTRLDNVKINDQFLKRWVTNVS